MKRCWRRLVLQFSRDDLAIRVLFLWAGTLALAGGMFIAIGVGWSTLSPASSSTPCATPIAFGSGGFWFVVVLVSVLIGWSALLMVRGFVPADSRWAEISERALHDGGSLEGVAVLIVVLLIPVALLVPLLRWLGVRGQRRRRAAQAS